MNYLNTHRMQSIYSKKAILRFSFYLVALLASSTQMLAQKTWSAASGNWSDPSKWSPVGVPISTDHVTISGTVTLDVSPSIGSLVLNGTIQGTGDISVSGNLTQNSGDLRQVGNINVVGVFTWNGGWLGHSTLGGGVVTIGGATSILTGSSHYMMRKQLICNGGMTHRAGEFYIGFGGKLTIPSGQDYTTSGGVTGALNAGVQDGIIEVLGSMVKNSSGTYSVHASFVNSGIVKITNGDLRLVQGLTNTSTGILSGHTSTSYQISGTITNLGKIAPGINNIGTMGITRTSLPISTLDVELAAGTPVQKDLLNVTGSIVLTGSTLNVTEVQCLPSGTYTFLT
jgi:hypothetical protein